MGGGALTDRRTRPKAVIQDNAQPSQPSEVIAIQVVWVHQIEVGSTRDGSSN